MLRRNMSTASDANVKVSTLIGEGAVFDGNLSIPDTVRIDGTINGNCSCNSTLILGEAGQIFGNINAHNIIISGSVKGDITAKGKLEFLPTGKLTGNIVANTLVIDEGAYVDGKCTMTSDAPVPSFVQQEQED